MGAMKKKLADHSDKPDPALKGVKHGNCNRTACQQPGAEYFSVWVHGAYYCRACAKLINDANRNEARSMYGVENCLFRPSDLTPEDRAKLARFDIPTE